MKKCPSCERTFDDNMRFCQTDGTPLVDDAPPVDPYKTMVASSEEIKAAMPVSSEPKRDDEVLQLPTEADPKKTMYASEEEIRQEMAAREEPVMDLPPLGDTPEPPAPPEPPKFSEPSLSPPSFGDVTPSAPPPSPLAGSSGPASEFSGDPFAKTTPPIPSPFDKPKPTTYEPPPSPNFPAISDPVGSSASAPFNPGPPAVEASASAPVQNWEPNEPMQNAPVSPAVQGQNKTLAIVSLVLGIVSFLCCNSLFVFGLAAIITGFMAKSKASSSAEYGGGGLALGGIILGVLSLLIGIVYWVLVITGTITLPQFS